MKNRTGWRKTLPEDPILKVFTPEDAEHIRRRAADAGMTPEEFVTRSLLLPCLTERDEDSQDEEA